jgi:hypothetical protein
VPGPRIGIHLADWDGDGLCDVLTQDRATGALTWFQNTYVSDTDTVQFANRGIVNPGQSCTQGWGVGVFDRGMRLADIDGDRRADPLCIEPDGRITAWLNTAGGMRDVGQVKFSEGWDRYNMRLADVEDSGRNDLIHLDKYTGAVTVFKNNGKMKAGNSSFSWTNRGVLYSPIDRGENMVSTWRVHPRFKLPAHCDGCPGLHDQRLIRVLQAFANLGGLNRADLIHQLPYTNRVSAGQLRKPSCSFLSASTDFGLWRD